MYKCFSSLRCCFFPSKLNISANQLIDELPKSGNDPVINNHDNQSNYEPLKLITINSLIYPQSINYISSQTENSDRLLIYPVRLVEAENSDRLLIYPVRLVEAENSDRLLIYPVRLVGAKNSLPLAEAISPPPSPSLTASQGFRTGTLASQLLLV